MKRLLLLLLIVKLTASVAFYLVSPSGDSEKSLLEAYKAYKDGEQATNVNQRSESFNKALSLYTSLEKQNNPKYGNGKLYYNIANSYFQLGQYPQAVLYYYRALALMPKEEKIQRNLQVALLKLNLPYHAEDSVFNQIFFFHYEISYPNQLRLFFLFALLATLLASLYIWIPYRSNKRSAILLALIALVFLASIGYKNYFTSAEGVIIKSTPLYRDAGEQYAKVLKNPVFSGTKVLVLDVLQEGKWLKIMTPQGVLGYVPQNSIEII